MSGLMSSLTTLCQEMSQQQISYCHQPEQWSDSWIILNCVLLCCKMRHHITLTFTTTSSSFISIATKSCQWRPLLHSAHIVVNCCCNVIARKGVKIVCLADTKLRKEGSLKHWCGVGLRSVIELLFYLCDWGWCDKSDCFLLCKVSILAVVNVPPLFLNWLLHCLHWTDI